MGRNAPPGFESLALRRDHHLCRMSCDFDARKSTGSGSRSVRGLPTVDQYSEASRGEDRFYWIAVIVRRVVGIEAASAMPSPRRHLARRPNRYGLVLVRRLTRTFGRSTIWWWLARVNADGSADGRCGVSSGAGTRQVCAACSSDQRTGRPAPRSRWTRLDAAHRCGSRRRRGSGAVGLAGSWPEGPGRQRIRLLVSRER